MTTDRRPPFACVILLLCFVILLLQAGSRTATAEEIYFPPGANVINVVEDLDLDNTGQTDVTEELDELYSKMGRQIQIVYFPKGTYLVSGTVMGKYDTSRSSQSHSHGPWLVGESREETVIRLKDGTWPEDPLDSQDMPGQIDEQVVLHTGDATNTTFNQVIRNMTVNIGRNNDGAVGIVYNTSNTGRLSEVDIVSEDGQGAIGLSLSGSENGPGQIRDVRIQGFKRGLYNAAPYYMATSNLTIDGTTEVGLLNRGPIAGENFEIHMADNAPAVRNTKSGGLILTGGRFRGAGPAAIENDGELYVRDVETSGYQSAIRTSEAGNGTSQPADTNIDEYYTGQSAGAFGNPGRSLRLPIKQPPYPAWEHDPAKWANPHDYKTDDNTWTEAFQAALNEEGKTHMVIPYGTDYPINGPLVVGNDYERIVGTGGQLKPGDEARLIVGDGSAPVVVLEWVRGSLPVHVRTDRTVIMDGVRPKTRYGGRLIAEGGGELFINDVGGCDILVTNPQQRVWLRHYNHEFKSLALTVEAGRVWVLGWKSENLGQRVRQSGGELEILGFQSYEVGSDKAGGTPIFEVNGGRFSAVGIDQDGVAKHRVLVQEQRGDETRQITPDNNPGGHDCPLCTAYPAP